MVFSWALAGMNSYFYKIVIKWVLIFYWLTLIDITTTFAFQLYESRHYFLDLFRLPPTPPHHTPFRKKHTISGTAKALRPSITSLDSVSYPMKFRSSVLLPTINLGYEGLANPSFRNSGQDDHIYIFYFSEHFLLIQEGFKPRATG